MTRDGAAGSTPDAHSDCASRSLWNAFARSVRDNFIAEVAVQALRFGGMVILARALRPGDFGLFRVLVVVSAFAMLVNESGIPDALIQRKTITPAHESTAWWLSLALAMVSSAGLYAAAPLAARAMAMPELAAGIRMLCIPILLEGTAVTANARLRRLLRFGALAVADVIGEAAFLMVALAMLWAGYPRLSLASALGARFVFHAVSVWAVDPYLPRVLPRLSAARDFTRFSSSVLGGRLIVLLSSNADFLLVGRLLGSSALGFYSMAWDLLRFIPDRLSRVAGRVTLPAFCRLQDDDRRLAKAYRDFFSYLCRFVIPIVACASIAAPELIGFVYGPKWVPAATQMRLLAPGLILLGLRVGIGSIYYTKDHPSFDIYLHTTRLVLIVATVAAAAAAGGLSAVSIGMSFVESVVSVAGQWMACALVGLSIASLCADALPALILTAMCGVATMAGRSIGKLAGANDAVLIALIALFPAVVFIWREAGDLGAMVSRAFGSQPASIDLTEERA